MADSRNPSVIIVGAGFGGIATAIELQSHGFTEITMLDRAPAVGGTWFYNEYPGAACDVPSHLYSFSYAQRRNWSKLCSPQQEILDYITAVARDHGLDRVFQPNVHVTAARWEEAAGRWTVEAEDGRTWSADALVVATGQLNQPSYPRIDGAEEFAGVSFHSARWNHDYDLHGKRVAVVGTGASAVQFVPPVAEQAAELTVYQRSGNWFLPRRNDGFSAPYRWAIEHLPGVQTVRRAIWMKIGEYLTLMIRNPDTFGRLGALTSRAFMRSQLKDPETRRKAMPDYQFGCKRVLFSSAYLPALCRPNVELVTDAVARITPHGVITADGTERPADCIIWGTGFKTGDFMFPMEITGTGGRSLREEWAGGAHAHNGIAVPGYPSLFLVYGPNTNTSGGSIIFYEEVQAGYIRQALQQVRARGAAAIEVRAEVEAASDQALQARFPGTAWTRCDSWYRDADGRIITNWPGYMYEYERALRTLDPHEFAFLPVPEPAETAAA